MLLLLYKDHKEFKRQKGFFSDLTFIEFVRCWFLNQIELMSQRYGLPFHKNVHFHPEFYRLQWLLDFLIIIDVWFPFFHPLSQELTGNHELIQSVSLLLAIFMPKMIQEVCVDRSQSFHFQGFWVPLRSYFAVHSFCLEYQRVCL